MEYSKSSMAFHSVLQVIMAYLAAFVLWLLIEAPFARLPALLSAATTSPQTASRRKPTLLA